MRWRGPCGRAFFLKGDMMDLKTLLPGSMVLSSEGGLQEVLKMFLMRTNFVPSLRHVLGWRGVQNASCDSFGWTAKVKNNSGVYGLSYDSASSNESWILGIFPLFYFPWPEDEMVECCSVHAAALTGQDFYLERIRNFPHYPDFASVFHIADVRIAVNVSENAFMIGLESLSRHRVITEDGIVVQHDGNSHQIVDPGGYDENFPSYETAFAYFRILAASVTFNLREAPRFLFHKTYPGYVMHYNSEGVSWRQKNNEIKGNHFCLGYGTADFMAAAQAVMFGKKEVIYSEQLWREGLPAPAGYEDELWWNAHHLDDGSYVNASSIGVESRPPLIIVSGFLGSGKTSFIKSFIDFHLQRNRFVAVIQNEIGEIGLDGKMLDNDYAVMEVDEGCVCCSLVGSVKRAVRQILSRFHPDYIIVETTGVANPFNLLDEIGEMKELVRFDGVSTLVDASNIETSMKQFGIAVHQVEAADVLVVNKKDLVNEETLIRVKALLREKNSTAPLVVVEQGYINPSLLYGIDFEEMAERIDQDMVAPFVVDKTGHIHDGLESVKIDLPETLDKETFFSKIHSLPPFVFRAKGVVRFEHDSNPCIVQYVNGRYDLEECSNERFRDRFLVFIGKGVKEETFRTFIT